MEICTRKGPPASKETLYKSCLLFRSLLLLFLADTVILLVTSLLIIIWCEVCSEVWLCGILWLPIVGGLCWKYGYILDCDRLRNHNCSLATSEGISQLISQAKKWQETLVPHYLEDYHLSQELVQVKHSLGGQIRIKVYALQNISKRNLNKRTACAVWFLL